MILYMHLQTFEVLSTKQYNTMTIPGAKITQSIVYYEQKPNNTIVNQSQLMKLVDKAFQQFDRNRTGQLDSVQLKAFLQFAVKQKILQQCNKNLFYEYIGKIDTNRDGLVSKQQLYNFFLNRHNPNYNRIPTLNGPPPSSQKPKKVPQHIVSSRQYIEQQIENIDQTFQKYDTNKTGQLDYRQTKVYLQEVWNNKYSYHQIIKGVDQNKNGLIGKNQLLAFLKTKRQYM